jgi:hypothetical protein
VEEVLVLIVDELRDLFRDGVFHFLDTLTRKVVCREDVFRCEEAINGEDGAVGLLEAFL